MLLFCDSMVYLTVKQTVSNILSFSLYERLVNVDLLAHCSDGFRIQVNFALQAVSAVLGAPCEVPELSTR